MKKKINLPPSSSGEPDITVMMETYFTKKALENLSKIMSYLKQSGSYEETTKMKDLVQKTITDIVTPEGATEVTTESVQRAFAYCIAVGYHFVRLLWRAEVGIKERPNEEEEEE